MTPQCVQSLSQLHALHASHLLNGLAVTRVNEFMVLCAGSIPLWGKEKVRSILHVVGISNVIS